MSTNRDRIVEALEQSLAGICDNCLSTLAEVTPPQQVNQICRKLSGHGQIERAKGKCGFCGRTKQVNRLKGSAAPAVQSDQTIPPSSPRGALQMKDAAARLDQVRRRIIEILNSIDGSPKKIEGLSARVSRLRERNSLPGSIACMMLTLNTLRNLSVYERFVPGRNELTVIEAAWSAVEEWWESKAR